MNKKALRTGLFVLMIVLCFAFGFGVMTLLKGSLGQGGSGDSAGQAVGKSTPEAGESASPSADPVTVTISSPGPEQEEEEEKPPANMGEVLDSFFIHKRYVSDWSVLVLDLESGETTSRHWNHVLWTSDPGPCQAGDATGLIRLWVMGAVYEQQNGIPDRQIRSQLEQMITQSKDSATASLITDFLGGGDAEVGLEKVNAFAAALGCSHTVIGEADGSDSRTSVEDCGIILRQIYEGSCVSAECSEDMLSLLNEQQNKAKIASGVPAGSTVGSVSGYAEKVAENEAAIVVTPNGSYILCIMCMSPSSNASAILQFGQIATAVDGFLAGD